jgi:predicted metalloprotease with PDZ domain
MSICLAQPITILGLLVAGVSGCAGVRPPSGRVEIPDLAYEVVLVDDGPASIAADLALHVDGAAEGVTTFTLAEGREHRDVERSFAGMVARGAEDRELSVTQEAGPRWIVRHRPGEHLTLRWRHTRPLPADEDRTGRYFRLTGAGSLPFPRHLGTGDRRIQLRWRGFAEAGWRTASSFGLHQELKFDVARWRFLNAHFLAAPQVTFTRRELDAERAVMLAVVGRQWKFSSDVLADDAIRIVRGVREFFADPGPPLYVITVVPQGPYSEGKVKFAGSGLMNSFAMRLQPPASYQDLGELLRMILTHELLHNWYGQTIVQGEYEPVVAWFFEGFTTFHTRRLMYRMGLLSLDGVVEDLNRRLEKYLRSPARNAPNRAIVPHFFDDPRLGDQPYFRGDFLAMLVDMDLRRHSGGRRTLDDVIKEMVVAGRAGARETNASLLERLTRETSAARGDELRAVALEGRTLALPADVLAPCLNLETSQETPRFAIADASACPGRL